MEDVNSDSIMCETQGICQFCNIGDVNEEDLGPLYRRGTITVHKNCLYFSSGLCQNDDTDKGLFGFLDSDINREIRRGRNCKQRCCGCGQRGLYIGCAIPKCHMAGHLPCLLKKGFLLQFYDNFRAYCSMHRPFQKATLSSQCSYSCSICLGGITFSDATRKQIRVPLDIMITPCCNNICHRKCVQAQARSAGIHYFRCPTCNNQDKFNDKMLQLGIEIPIRDASWELCDQFSDLHNPEMYCTLPVCDSSYGRKIRTMDKFINCNWCGQCIGHNDCFTNDTSIVVMVNTDNQCHEYICLDCRPVYENRRSSKYNGGHCLSSSQIRIPLNNCENSTPIMDTVSNNLSLNNGKETISNMATPTKNTTCIAINVSTIPMNSSVNLDMSPRNTNSVSLDMSPIITNSVNLDTPPKNITLDLVNLTTPTKNTNSVDVITPDIPFQNNEIVVHNYSPIKNITSYKSNNNTKRTAIPPRPRRTITKHTVLSLSNNGRPDGCTVSQCGCIYGRSYNSARGCYSLIACTKCSKYFSHLECYKLLYKQQSSHISSQPVQCPACAAERCNHDQLKHEKLKRKRKLDDDSYNNEDVPDDKIISGNLICISSDEDLSQEQNTCAYSKDSKTDTVVSPKPVEYCKERKRKNYEPRQVYHHDSNFSSAMQCLLTDPQAEHQQVY